jgi:hypothetical protein
MRMWTGWSERAGRRQKRSSPVVLEAKRLLAGETFVGRSGPARSPASTGEPDLLAHADRARLQALQGEGTLGAPGSWIATLGYLSSELTSGGLGERDVGDRQRRLLVPLELRILGREISAPTSPAELARLVLDALGQHPMPRDL